MDSRKLILYVKFIGHLLRRSYLRIRELYSHYKAHASHGTDLFGNNHLQGARIGKYSYLAYNAIAYHCEIGRYCSIGPNVVIGFGNHNLKSLSTHPALYLHAFEGMADYAVRMEDAFKPVIIENDVWVGANVYIRNGVRVGNGAVVGAGSIVLEDVPPYAIVAGVPARIIKYRFDPETVKRLLDSKWWERDLDSISLDIKAFEEEQRIIT
jgi:acetyltransferase-like isoleucine patch superfamily enzyme